MTKSDILEILSQEPNKNAKVFFLIGNTSEILPVDSIAIAQQTENHIYLILHDRRINKRTFSGY